MTIRHSTPLVATILFIALGTMPRLASAQKLSDADLKKVAASASIAADHTKLAAHYRAHAVEHETDAALHEEIVAAARKQPQFSGHAWEVARGAAHYAEHSREAAEALRELAAVHDGMAEVAARQTRR